jgi:ATP synthase protein I
MQKPHADEHYSQAQHAWRMVIELVAGLVGWHGFTLGWMPLWSPVPLSDIIHAFRICGWHSDDDAHSQ